MAAEIVMAQVDGAAQVSQLLAASGSKTFCVGKVATAAGAGAANNIITLTPSAGGSAIAVKLEGARQTAELTSMVGKTVAIGKPSMMAGAGAVNNWLIFQPVGAGAKVAGTSATLFKLEGARQGMQAAALACEKFTVVKPMMAGKGATSTLFLQPAGGGDLVALKMANGANAASGLVGKTVIVGKAPAIAGANASSWLVLKPAATATGAKAAGTATAAKVAAPMAAKAKAVAMTAPMAKFQTVAMTTAPAAGAGAGATGASVAKSAVSTGAIAKGAATGGTIWKGTGLSLGLGLGLGAWGPVILAGVGVSAAYGYWRTRREDVSDEVAIQDI
jgi:hypothetical protein